MFDIDLETEDISDTEACIPPVINETATISQIHNIYFSDVYVCVTYPFVLCYLGILTLFPPVG